MGGPGRRAARRAKERRRRSRAGMLRPRRQRADGDGLQSPARLPRHGVSARRRLADRPCGAAAAVRKRLAEPLAVDMRTAAAAVIDVVNHAMAEALKIVSVQRGHDPRDFALAAFGGAGAPPPPAPAGEPGIAAGLCPPIPGALSAPRVIGTVLQSGYAQTLGAAAAPHPSAPAGALPPH